MTASGAVLETRALVAGYLTTSYQAEVAQGVLQALFEFQTMVARLAGVGVANASLYDGASATVEAVNLATSSSGRPSVWISQGVHPHWRQVVTTFAAGEGRDVVEIPLEDGLTAWPDGRNGVGAVVAAYPNLREVIWAQEEPQNMGAWRTIRHRLEAPGAPLSYVGRPWRASPSEGYPTAHLREQDRIVRAALGVS